MEQGKAKILAFAWHVQINANYDKL